MSVIVPRLTELAAFRRSVNRKMWACIGLITTIGLGGLALAFIAFTRPVPVVMFDGEGRPVLFDDTVTPRVELSLMRVEHFAEAFIERFVEVDSATVEQDFAKALNMMTPRLRQLMLGDPAETQRRQASAHGNLRGAFDELHLRVAEFDPEDVDGRVYLVAHGPLRFAPRFGDVIDGPAEVTQHALVELALQRVPVSRGAIHGLLVDYAHTRFFPDAEALARHGLQRARARGPSPINH